MGETYIQINENVSLAEEPNTGHNRWHPDIPPIASVEPGEKVILETRDSFDGQISSSTTVDDLRTASLRRLHPLTGPIHVEGAEPGDLIAVQIEDVEPISTGYTVIMPGFGFLRDLFPEPFILHWTTSDGYATCPELPGVRVPGAPFMGVMGLAPSHELLSTIKDRESEVHRRGGLAMPPDSSEAVPATEPIASEAIRTISPQEFGGNMDIKQHTAGTVLYLPVYQPGGLFSVGDAHFAQGDGETCGTAIETAATFTARFKIEKGEAKRRGQSWPSFSRDDYFLNPETSVPKRFYATTGYSVTSDGQADAENLTVAARNAALNMIEYLMDAYGYTREQAYCLVSVAVDLKVSQLVDVPNLIVSAYLPLDVLAER